MKPPNFTVVQILSLTARVRKTPYPAALYPGPRSVEKAWLPGKVIFFPRKLNVFSFFAIWRTVHLLSRGATTPTTKQILGLLFLCYGEQNGFLLRDFLVTTYLEVLKPFETLVVQTQKL